MNITKYKDLTTSHLNLTETKNWLRVDVNVDDTLISGLIYQARDIIENFLGLCLDETEITAVTYNTYSFELPYQPVTELISVKTWSGQTDLTYSFDQMYVSIEESYGDSLEVRWKAGYTNLPQGLKSAWLQTIAYLYEHRGDEGIEKFLLTNYNLNTFRKTIIL